MPTKSQYLPEQIYFVKTEWCARCFKGSHKLCTGHREFNEKCVCPCPFGDKK